MRRSTRTLALGWIAGIATALVAAVVVAAVSSLGFGGPRDAPSSGILEVVAATCLNSPRPPPSSIEVYRWTSAGVSTQYTGVHAPPARRGVIEVDLAPGRYLVRTQHGVGLGTVEIASHHTTFLDVAKSCAGVQ